MSGADGEPHRGGFDFSELRKKVIASLRGEGRYDRRELDACLALLRGFVEVVERFQVIAWSRL